MSKNRNIADLLDANGDVKLTSLDNIDLTNLNANHLTSGSIPDARVPASAVSQHATSFDDNKIVNDISTLALRQASDGNRSAYNTNSQFVDVFQDSTGIGSFTQCQRDTNEYVSSSSQAYSNTATKLDWFNPTQVGGGTTNYQVKCDDDGGGFGNASYTDVVESGTIQYVSYAKAITLTEGDGWGHSGGHTGKMDFYADYKETKRFSTRLDIAKNNNWGDINQMKLEYSTDGTNFTAVDLSSASQSGSTVYGRPAGSGGGFTSSSGTSAGLFSMNANSTNTTFLSGFTMIGLPDFDARYIRFSKQSLHSAANNNVGGIYWDFFEKALVATTNATGNFLSNAITAPSSINKMGAIITYQDQAGTNALNTDIVLQLSADGGSNFTTATLTALPDFATGIKMCKVNDLTIGTAGTSLKYKISFANQSGSKEARIRGVSLQF